MQSIQFMMTQQYNQTFSTQSNSKLVKQVLEELISQGIKEFCLCPGARNAPFVYPLVHSSQVNIYYWSEERSAAFFALGKIKSTQQPVAVVTTSGTAAAELLPAVMESYYTGLPLILITADRPRRFRGTGAPQSAEQVNLFGCYAHDMQDLADDDVCSLDQWTRHGPIHLNVCVEEPKDSDCQLIRLDDCLVKKRIFNEKRFDPDERYLHFVQSCDFPFVIVGALPSFCREAAIDYLIHLNAPIYAEGISGIREEPRLEHLRIKCIDYIWHCAEQHNYPIDGILRLGTVPTARLWRDLECKKEKITVCSISEQPFSGLSDIGLMHTSLISFFKWAKEIKSSVYAYQAWKKADEKGYQALLNLFETEPLAEASLIHALSCQIPIHSNVYLGNSLPIREWDQAATYYQRHFQIESNRGVNGIDGQLATFLGYCTEHQDNWAILGDLTVLYDLVAPWIYPQLSGMNINVVIVNNGGAGIFKRMFAHSAFQNMHQLNFEPLAQFWGQNYERWKSIPAYLTPSQGLRFIELMPNSSSSARFSHTLQSNFLHK